MSLFYRRPLALFCCLFAVASLGGCFLDSDEKVTLGLIILSLSALSSIFCICFKKYRAKLLYATLCLVFLAVTLFNTFIRIDTKNDRFTDILEQEVELEMTVLSVRSASAAASTYQIRFLHGGVSHEGLLSCEYSTDFEAGDIIQGIVIPKPIEEIYIDPEYYRARGIFFALTTTENTLTVTGSAPLGFRENMMRLNSFLANVLETTVEKDSAGMLSAVFLGNRTALSDSVLRDFRRAGLSHVLAISGMHLAILVSIMESFLRFFGIPKRGRSILVLLLAFFYMALTGFSLSTVRAFIMVAFVYLAYLSGNQNDTVTSLFFALFIILLLSPTAVWDVGLWMSFLAVLGIIIASYFTKKLAIRLHKSRIRPRLERILVAFLSAIIISLFANIFVCLPMCLCFDELSLISAPSTLIISPLISVLLFLAPLLLLCSLVALFSFLSPILATACHAVCWLMQAIISLLSEPNGITVSLRYPFVPYIIIPTSLLLFLLLTLPLRKKFWIPLVPTIATLLFVGMLFVHNNIYEEQVTVDYLSFGESEMMVLTTTKDAVICDLSTGGNQYLYDAISLARERFQVEISALVLTHYHTRHINTFARNADSYKIRSLYVPFPENADEYYIMYSLIDVAQKKDVAVILFDRGKEISPTPSIKLELSKPVYLKRSTHPTFILSVSSFDERVTYVAESFHETDALSESTRNQLQASNHIILGTHGPKTKTVISDESLYHSEFLFVFDESVFSYMDPSSASDCHLVYGSDSITLRLKNKKQ